MAQRVVPNALGLTAVGPELERRLQRVGDNALHPLCHFRY